MIITNTLRVEMPLFRKVLKFMAKIILGGIEIIKFRRRKIRGIMGIHRPDMMTLMNLIDKVYQAKES